MVKSKRNIKKTPQKRRQLSVNSRIAKAKVRVQEAKKDFEVYKEDTLSYATDRYYQPGREFQSRLTQAEMDLDALENGEEPRKWEKKGPKPLKRRSVCQKYSLRKCPKHTNHFGKKVDLFGYPM